MTSLTRVKLLVAAAGVSVWGVGVRLGDDRLRWGGVALLALAVLLRLFRDEEARGGGRAARDGAADGASDGAASDGAASEGASDGTLREGDEEGS